MSTQSQQKCQFCKELEKRIIALENSKGVQFGFYGYLCNEYEVTPELIDVILTEADIEYKPANEEEIERLVYVWLNKKIDTEMNE